MTIPTMPVRDMTAQAVLLAVGALLLIRVAALLLSPVELYADEAQYWRWSRSFDWGYYSKPPMIAWVIGSTTALFGNAEWAVRLAAPFLHAIAAWALFLLGREMYSPRVGLLAALGYSLMPGVILSASVISTDGVLLPFWSLALLFLCRLHSRALGWPGAVALGVCLGIGFLSKYAMVYFVIGMALLAAFDRDTRRATLSPKGLTALAIAAALVAPHLIWNAANDFKTVGHTVDNANLGGELFNPENLGKFIEDQMGVFGPVSFLALLGGIWAFILRPAGSTRDRRDLWLLAFIVPVIVIIGSQSVLSRAHANWAATAYPAGSVLIAAWLVRAAPRRWLWIAIAALVAAAFLLAPDISLLLRSGLALGGAGTILIVGLTSKWRPVGLLWSSFAMHGAIFVLLICLFAAPPAFSTAMGLDQALRRVRGWDDTARQVHERAQAMGASAILVDEREVWHALDYYMRDLDSPPLIAWRRQAGPKSFAETRPMDGEIDDRVLIVSYWPQFRPRLRGDFETFEPAGDIEIALGRYSNGCPVTRRFALYIARGHDPRTRDQAWEDAYEGLSERDNPRCP